MIKKTYMLACFLMTGLILSSCGKEEDPVVTPPTTTAAEASLHVIIYEQLSNGSSIPQSKAKMQLYKTQADYDNKTNAVADIVADDAGNYTFTKLEPINYLFRAESADASKNNSKSGNQTGVLVNNQTKELNVIVK